MCVTVLALLASAVSMATGGRHCDPAGGCAQNDSNTHHATKQTNDTCAVWETPHTTHLENLQISSRHFIDAFPLDAAGTSVRTVTNGVFSLSAPTPLRGPLTLVAVSKEVLEDILDLDLSVLQSEDFVHYFSGGKPFPGSVPLAHRYGGHQFGYWAGQLGDGRAHLLGEYTNKDGERWELQLKGSGKTPYSRSGDGRAVLRSSVREFLCSEAMHYLGVPTSRAASLIVSDEPVWRDQFYDGNVTKERGAVVLRLAKSWFRIGSLEILTRSGEVDLLRKLLDFILEKYFPTIQSNDPDKFLVFYSKVVNETAQLVARWMSVGFAHGVCNTDNFSLLSVTIDYGPFGFMESFDPSFVPNWSDDEGRYSMGQQANGGRFLEFFKAKLGLLGHDEKDEDLIAFLLKLMEDTHADFTMTFRQLSELSDHQSFLGVHPQVHLLQRILRWPFQEQAAAEAVGYAAQPPAWARELKVSCSS
ncbi:selenoprotein O-like [Scleropages formosus]|uniref:Selenoprotein O n=1 Tax=Scleropages formosus TaxID=113540 RepID=A0A0P7VPH6_SCLFO|nr:selenoprotein O-like [Scleropages formosus]